MNSCLYDCEVMHHRLEPREHRFRYRLFLFALDVDDIDSLARRMPVFSRNRWNAYSFYDRDHALVAGRDGAGVREKLTAYLAGEGVDLPPGGRVVLLTLPRMLGYVFNPVSFYFCFGPGGEPRCAVAEVGNTFGEQKLYLLQGPPEGGAFRRIAPKQFYISPFSDLEVCLDFKLRLPGENLEIHIDDRVGGAQGGRRVLLSSLTGRRLPLTTPRLLWFLLKYPALTLRVILLIHWHALLLWGKRVPLHRKAAEAHLQRGVRPHASIAPKTP